MYLPLHLPPDIYFADKSFSFAGGRQRPSIQRWRSSSRRGSLSAGEESLMSFFAAEVSERTVAAREYCLYILPEGRTERHPALKKAIRKTYFKHQ